MIVLETIDLNATQSLYALSNRLKMRKVFPSKVTIWKLRNNNPMRKSSIYKTIKFDEFDALIKLVVEMSKYLYPYIRDVLQSREDYENDPTLWDDFKNRFIELISERFNIDSMRVKKLADPNQNDTILLKSLLTLAFCTSDEGYKKLETFLVSH